jgi:hypothetical protein
MGRLLRCIMHAQLHTGTVLRKLIAVRRYILCVDSQQKEDARPRILFLSQKVTKSVTVNTNPFESVI